MKCIKCKSTHTTFNGRYRNGVQRYKCSDCGKQFSELTFRRFYRHRFPNKIIIIAIFFHLFIPARVVQIFLFFLFRCYVSKKAICSWTKKFLDNFPEIQPTIKKSKFVIAHADEKFIKIKKEKAYWWNTTDNDENPLTSIITMYRDSNSVRELFKDLPKCIDIMVTDGYHAYKDPVRKLGCKHVIAGIKNKIVIHKEHLFILSNLAVERLHSRIDYFMQRFKNSFENLESANRWRKAFMLTAYLQESLALQKSFGTFSTALNKHLTLREVSVPVQ